MTTQRQTIDERLQDNPHLRARMEAILDIAENKASGPDTADAAEERAIIELQKLGQEVMRDWAEKKAAREVAAYRVNHKEARRHKKNELLAHDVRSY